MIKAVLMDIEGTTTSISFVHDVLFPYSKEHLPAYVRKNAETPVVLKYLAQARETIREESGRDPGNLEEIIKCLLKWIEKDRKHGALKGLQGLIWEDGYRQKSYTSHIYDDVAPCLDRWHKTGLKLAIYSSGSVKAQKLLFANTSGGDLTGYFTAHFDTCVGGKRETASYEKITKALGLKADEVLFLSDVCEELDAAKSAGMATVQLVRPGTTAENRHKTAASFVEIEPSAF